MDVQHKDRNFFQTFVGIVALAILAFVYMVVSYRKKKKKIVGYISKLYVYPVKSAMRVDLEEVDVTNLGLRNDRQFVLLNKYGTFMTLRKYPKLVLIKPLLKSDGIYLHSNNMSGIRLPLEMAESDGEHVKPDITVWRKTTAGVHVSKEVDDWFATYLGVEGCKMYCFPKNGVPRYAEDKGVQVPDYSNENDTCMFADGCPLMLLSESSVEEFCELAETTNLTVERFRPNIVIAGSTPFAEDDWGNLEIGNVKLQNLYPCDRCVAVNVDPFNADLDKTVLPAIARHRPAPEKFHGMKGGHVFGCNYGVRRSGRIKVGDPIYLVS